MIAAYLREFSATCSGWMMPEIAGSAFLPVLLLVRVEIARLTDGLCHLQWVGTAIAVDNQARFGD